MEKVKQYLKWLANIIPQAESSRQTSIFENLFKRIHRGLLQRYIKYYFCWRDDMMPTEFKIFMVLYVVLLGLAVNGAVPLVVYLFFKYVPVEGIENLSKYVVPIIYFVANAVFFRQVFLYACEGRCENCTDADSIPYKEKYEKLLQEYKLYKAYFDKREGNG